MQERYLTVVALTRYIKYKFDNDRHLLNVYLKGEISNFKRHSRGHFYFTLKDQHASIQAMMFSNDAKDINFDIKDGMNVLVRGSISVYEPYGTYQITVQELKLDGIGDLYLAYEALKKELSLLGLFDQDRKKMIPKFPKRIGVVTSPTGAAVKDIINTISRRYPIAEVIIYPALVQGEYARDSIVKQIKQVNKDKLVDTLIVGRGGGSIEDLWCFNEKEVAYAIFESVIPVISAVGHEVDYTISDFVADVRAATPTAAAEIATPNKYELIQYIKSLNERLNIVTSSVLKTQKVKLMHLDNRLDASNPYKMLKDRSKELNQFITRLNQAYKQLIEYKQKELNHKKELLNEKFNQVMVLKRHQFEMQLEKLRVLNPLALMDKGYSIVKHDNKIIKSIKDVKRNDELDVTLSDGNVKCKVI